MINNLRYAVLELNQKEISQISKTIENKFLRVIEPKFCLNKNCFLLTDQWPSG